MNNKLTQILSKVQKPGRYIGGETNSVVKKHTENMVSVLLAYPDTYEVGMSYLGLRILYHLLNERRDVVCERAFMPWEDMEKEILENNLRLFSLETKTDINKFDIVGFSLSYELTYTNVLSMLHMSGITLFSNERREDEPLIIAGGACSYNPEPMSSFIDAFIIGDGEESLSAFIDAYKKAGGRKQKRRDLLKAIAGLEGVYVPSLYEAEYFGGKFLGLKPLTPEAPPAIKKAHIKSLEEAYYPVKQIVPLVKIVHDRLAVEIMRGCPNGCRFCQAAIINRPVRIRTPERLRSICREAYEHTGYERIALLSLSSVNYPHLADLIKGLTEDFKGRGVGISIPSLRVDEAFYDLPEMLGTIRKTGLTFAPESSSEAIRKSLGKDIDIQVLCKSASLAFRHGWQRLKLYFMVGFPGESLDEAERIIKLARELSMLKKEVSGGAAEIKVSVNPFVSKPHTPLQWMGMKGKEELSHIKSMLLSKSSKKIKIDFSSLEQSVLEACLSRGDRTIANVIHSAWKNGAKMDSWREWFNFEIWEKAFDDEGLNLYEYAQKSYALDDCLPWEHIKTGTSEKRLKDEFVASGFAEQAQN